MTSPRADAPPGSLLGETDVHLFHEGTHRRLHQKLGAHPRAVGGRPGTHFAVWAPNAGAVTVIGDFNGWKRWADRLRPGIDPTVWEGWVEGVGEGARYKFHVVSREGARAADKADPLAAFGERPPGTASIVAEPRHRWRDGAWMRSRGARNALDAPMSVYEVHLGSWRRDPRRPSEVPSYRDVAEPLARWASEQGFTHVELMPVMEHPLYASWGYEVTGFFAPSARHGAPEDLMELVDVLHEHELGVILDWPAAHFPDDEHGLARFDGTDLYSYADPRRGWHPDWKTRLFDLSRREVRSFLISSAVSWLERYHADGLRVDAVASMLHRDFGRRAGDWLPNEQGGREDHGAADFLRELNRALYAEFPDVQVIAEDSTTWPGATRPVHEGGLGFGLKWDLGWMHDTLDYLALDPLARSRRHELLTFRGMYLPLANWILPLSHDEVVHGKRALLAKMPGDEWQRYASLRLLYAWMHAQPGKKLLFMGAELAEEVEWWHERGLHWERLSQPRVEGVRRLVAELNRLHREERALHELDGEPAGFEWLVVDDRRQSVAALLRRDRDGGEVLAALNFTPVPRADYLVGVPGCDRWTRLVDTDEARFGGSAWGSRASLESRPEPSHGRACSLRLSLPPLAALFYRREQAS